MEYSIFTIVAVYLVIIAFFLWLGANLTKWFEEIGSKVGETAGAIGGFVFGVVLSLVLWQYFGKKMATYPEN